MQTDRSLALDSERIAWDDLGYTADLTTFSHHVDITVWNRTEEVVRGFIKWDGCVNLEMGNPPMMLHFCEREELVNFGQMLLRLYAHVGVIFSS